ncbi:MAG: hypothetical protein HOP95_02480 [Sphingomonas sp.]|nr:hypothetical protein [Sphingomonas sp.]
MLIGRGWRAHIVYGRKHDLRGSGLLLGGGLDRRLYRLGCENARTRQSRGGNEGEAGMHDRLLDKLAPGIGRSSFLNDFSKWLRLLQDSRSLDLGRGNLSSRSSSLAQVSGGGR